MERGRPHGNRLVRVFQFAKYGSIALLFKIRLMVAAGMGHLEVVKYLAGERGAATDARTADGSTAAIGAACCGHLDVIRYLADERGAAIEVKGADGRSVPLTTYASLTTRNQT